MKIREAMTPDVRMVRPDQTIREAAHLMAELDIGALPVQDNDRLVGMITDRDIAVRAVAEGRGAETRIGDVMTNDIKYCYEDQTIEEVMRNMGEQRLRRLPVLNRDKRLVGILSLGDLALERGAQDEAGQALGGISRPGGEHSQATQRH
ncbi:CBS domain-containing protein [Steroidobacter sp. S1-65]|uniref:CBS domain-containing protein n=1 Tax=Steroidobacter gossypii TaxID=2805490 RepID=A0ABS1WS83_9GAMM|nr:CBS domain-containing protein [Steroidobacter gossypii]MBM0103848.1 CBS domain-containing protein [Steroidobacter gossypii]